jgi:hypothetical protein
LAGQEVRKRAAFPRFGEGGGLAAHGMKLTIV